MLAAGAKAVDALSKAMGWVGGGNSCMVGNRFLKLLMVWQLRVVITRRVDGGFVFSFYYSIYLLRTSILISKLTEKKYDAKVEMAGKNGQPVGRAFYEGIMRTTLNREGMAGFRFGPAKTGEEQSLIAALLLGVPFLDSFTRAGSAG